MDPGPPTAICTALGGGRGGSGSIELGLELLAVLELGFELGLQCLHHLLGVLHPLGQPGVLSQ